MNTKNVFRLLVLINFFSLSSFSSSIKTIAETLNDEKKSLISRPGCTGIGLGHKYVNGSSTKQVAITFFVRKKLPVEEIPVEYVIPTKINGYDTDVVEFTFRPIFIKK